MQYLITVYDYKNNLDKRLQSREAHLNGAKKLIKSNNILTAAAIIENDTMIGSTLVVDFKDENDLNSWLKIEPYVINKVWDMTTFKKIKLKIFNP